jgi:radical SAM protein (TIGR04043 family)
MTHLRVLDHDRSAFTAAAAATLPELLSELQARGLRWQSPHGIGLHRRGGAGPSDHKAIRIGGHTVMVPVHTHAAVLSPFEARQDRPGDEAILYRNGQRVMRIEFPMVPRFYARSTADGIPYWKIATLHASDVLATTVLQRCVRYGNRQRACQFCSIGQSLDAGATVVEKTPAQLAEVARAAVDLDGVAHAVLTTGTPPGDDRGAAVLARCSAAITRAVALPIQAQCEPPADHAWFARLKDAGVVTLGMHLEAVTEAVRQRIMPGKAEVPVASYLSAFEAAVQVFGRGQVTTYILAGLGDSHEAIVELCDRAASLGVYPFVVPFVPIVGTPLQRHAPPSAAFMNRLLSEVARVLDQHGLSSAQIGAGCGRCGACSTLRARELGHA